MNMSIFIITSSGTKCKSNETPKPKTTTILRNDRSFPRKSLNLVTVSGVRVQVAAAMGSAGSAVTCSFVEVPVGRDGATSTSLATFFSLESSLFDGS